MHKTRLWTIPSQQRLKAEGRATTSASHCSPSARGGGEPRTRASRAISSSSRETAFSAPPASRRLASPLLSGLRGHARANHWGRSQRPRSPLPSPPRPAPPGSREKAAAPRRAAPRGHESRSARARQRERREGRPVRGGERRAGEAGSGAGLAGLGLHCG